MSIDIPITAEFKVSSLGDDTPVFKLEGWNVEESEFYAGTQMLISAPEINRVGSDGDATLTDGSYTASVTLAAYEETPIDVNLYIGFYKNGELAAYTVKEINETLTESKTFTTEPITLDCGTYDGCEIKAFLWRDNGKVERSHRKDNEYLYATHTFYSFKDFEKQLKVHNRKYNKFPMRPLNWKSPTDYIKSYIKDGEVF